MGWGLARVRDLAQVNGLGWGPAHERDLAQVQGLGMVPALDLAQVLGRGWGLAMGMGWGLARVRELAQVTGTHSDAPLYHKGWLVTSHPLQLHSLTGCGSRLAWQMLSMPQSEVKTEAQTRTQALWCAMFPIPTQTVAALLTCSNEQWRV